MTKKEQLRLLIGDNDKIIANDQFGTGDSYTKYFQLSMHPVRATTEIITLGNSAQTRDTHYTIDNDTGLISMITAPSNGSILRAQKYEYNSFSDDELNDVLSKYGDDLNMSAAHCCRALAVEASRWFSYSSGDESVNKSMCADNFLAMAKIFEEKALVEQTGLMDIGMARTEIYQ